jgi:hypothetical protein
MARLATVITMGRPQPRGVVHRLGHVQQALAGGGRVGARAGGGGSDGHAQRGKFGLDVDELAALQCAGLHHLADAFDDMGLRRDRVGADHLGPAQRYRLGNGMGAFALFKHVDFPPHLSLRALHRPPRGPCLAWGGPALRQSSGLLFLIHDDVVGFAGGIHVALRHLALEFLPDGRLHRFKGNQPTQSRKRAQQGDIGDRPTDMFQGQFSRGHRQQALRPEAAGEFRQPSSAKLRVVLIRM